MSHFLAYLGTLRDFTQRNPIICWSTLGFVAVIAVLFGLLPARQPGEVVSLPRATSDARNAATEKEVSSMVVSPESKTRVTPQARPATGESQHSESKVARPGSGTGFTVQVGSFANEKAAQQWATALKASGHPAFVKAADINEKGRTYRVRVGLFTSRKEAKSYGDRLVKQEKAVKSVLTTIND